MKGGQDRFWLSGSDHQHQKCWIWAAPEISKVQEHLWAANEPDSNGQEDCSLLITDRLADVNCNRMQGFLCKRRRGYYPELPTLLDVYAVELESAYCKANADAPQK